MKTNKTKLCVKQKCRICGRAGRRFLDAFEQETDVEDGTLPDLAFKFLGLEIRKDDVLPKKICDDCSKKLITWQAFHMKCLLTQKKLLRDVEKIKDIQFCSEVRDNSEDQGTLSLGSVNGRRLRSKRNVSSVYQVVSKRHKIEENVECESHVEDVFNTENNVECENEVVEDVLNREEEDFQEKLLQYDVNSVEIGNKSEHENISPTDISEVLNGQLSEVFESETSETLMAARSVCTECGRNFNSPEALSRHTLSRHTEHRCSVCNKVFKNKFSLRCHMDVHAEGRRFCCHICGQLFRTAPCLCNHIRHQHSSTLPAFECPHCSKRFRQACHLTQHLRTHTGDRPYACSQCSQSFATQYQLTRHTQASHLGAKRFKCDFCGREFFYSSNYKAHLLQHEGHKGVQCTICGRSFVTNNGLLRHRRLHTGEKPFPCSVCGKCFADCSNRKRHMAQHSATHKPRKPRGPRNRKNKASDPPPSPTPVLEIPETSSGLIQQSNCLLPFSSVMPFISALQSSSVLSSSAALPEALAFVSPLDAPVSGFSHSTPSLTPSSLMLSSVAPAQSPPPPADLSLGPDEARTFSSLRAFLESSEVAEALGGGAVEGAAVAGSELVTLLAASEGCEGSVQQQQQLLLLPAGLLEALPVMGTDLELESLPSPLPSTAPSALLDKEAIVRMLNSQGTTIA